MDKPRSRRVHADAPCRTSSKYGYAAGAGWCLGCFLAPLAAFLAGLEEEDAVEEGVEAAPVEAEEGAVEEGAGEEAVEEDPGAVACSSTVAAVGAGAVGYSCGNFSHLLLPFTTGLVVGIDCIRGAQGLK
jgi:hypothetical protein